MWGAGEWRRELTVGEIFPVAERYLGPEAGVIVARIVAELQISLDPRDSRRSIVGIREPRMGKRDVACLRG